jgi:hypothetical protein
MYNVLWLLKKRYRSACFFFYTRTHISMFMWDAMEVNEKENENNLVSWNVLRRKETGEKREFFFDLTID